MGRRVSFFTYDSDFLDFVLGSGDSSALSSIEALFERDLIPYRHDNDTSELKRAKEIARRAIVDGCPFAELEAEGWEHVRAAQWLVEFASSPPRGLGEDWFATPFQEAVDTLAEGPLSKCQAVLDSLLVGRPLFGKTFVEDAYGFLTCDEVTAISRFEAEVLAWCDTVEPPAFTLPGPSNYTFEDVIHLAKEFTHVIRVASERRVGIWTQF